MHAAEVEKHRWFPEILKTRDPLNSSLGWWRYQSLPIYAVEDHNRRIRLCTCTAVRPCGIRTSLLACLPSRPQPAARQPITQLAQIRSRFPAPTASGSLWLLGPTLDPGHTFQPRKVAYAPRALAFLSFPTSNSPTSLGSNRLSPLNHPERRRKCREWESNPHPCIGLEIRAQRLTNRLSRRRQ